MDIELHKLCNCATANLHYSLNDCLRASGYILGMSTKEEAGRRIQAARLAKDMTLQDVHDLLPSISVSRLSNWEQGLNMIGVDEAKILAPVLGVTASYLMTTEDSPGDPRLLELNERYLACDDRGKAAILRTAETESVYATTPNRRNPLPESEQNAVYKGRNKGRRNTDRREQ